MVIISIFKQEGIHRQFAIAHTLQQNDVVKLVNRTFLDRTRAMLRTIGLAKSFWAKAVKTVYYVINQLPLIAISFKTQIEMWNGKPVDYSSLHMFGCLMYVMYNSQERTKLDPMSRKCIFLGYEL